MRDRRVVISHTHVLQDNEDLTQSAMYPWRTQTFFHLLPQRWRKSAYRSIFFRSRFVVHHSLQECDSSFRGGPIVSHRWWSRPPIAIERRPPEVHVVREALPAEVEQTPMKSGHFWHIGGGEGMSPIILAARLVNACSGRSSFTQ